MLDLETFAFVGLVFLVAILYFVREIHLRTKLMELRQARLSVNYFRIEAELLSLHVGLMALGSKDPEIEKEIASAFSRRIASVLQRIDNGPTPFDVLSGIELPDQKLDAAFWIQLSKLVDRQETIDSFFNEEVEKRLGERKRAA